MNVLGIIPARSGSKGIPNKNIKIINDKPLIYYTIKRAKNSKLITDLIASTDSKKYKKIFEKFKVQTILRPKNLSTDNSKIVDVIIYTLKLVEKLKKKNYDFICLLQPTSPLRKKNEIDTSIKKIKKLNANSLISIYKIEEPHPYKLFYLKNKKIEFFNKKYKKVTNRQQLPVFFKSTGNIYIFDRNTILKKKSIYGKKIVYDIIKKGKILNIDDKKDLILAKNYLKNFK